jgi:methane/ammonia monooxygenase subunit C
LIENNWITLVKPNKVDYKISDNKKFGTVVIEPLEKGFGTTLGNALRRVLLSSLQGTAITSIKINGVLHEFSTIEGVREDVTDIIMNLKNVTFNSKSNHTQKLSLNVKGPKEVLSSDFDENPEVEIQRLKKIWLIVIAMGSTAASVEVDNFVDGSLHQTSIRDSAFTPAHWWLYSHFIALPLGWGAVAIYDRKVPILRGPNNSMNTGLKMTILGYLATMFTIGVNEMWHFWFVEEIFAVPNHWMFNMGVVVAFMGALAYVVRVYARLVELGAESPGENPYVAEMYKLALEGKLYSRSIP